MNKRLSDQITEATAQIRSLAEANGQYCGETSLKLQEIIAATQQKITKDTSAPNKMALDTAGLQNMNNFSINAPISGTRLPCRKLDINGATSGTYFEFPSLVSSNG